MSSPVTDKSTAVVKWATGNILFNLLLSQSTAAIFGSGLTVAMISAFLSQLPWESRLLLAFCVATLTVYLMHAFIGELRQKYQAQIHALPAERGKWSLTTRVEAAPVKANIDRLQAEIDKLKGVENLLRAEKEQMSARLSEWISRANSVSTENVSLVAELDDMKATAKRLEQELVQWKGRCMPEEDPNWTLLSGQPPRRSHERQIEVLTKELDQVNARLQEEKERNKSQFLDLTEKHLTAERRYRNEVFIRALEKLFLLGCEPPTFRGQTVTIRYYDLQDAELADRVRSLFSYFNSSPWKVEMDRRSEHVQRKAKSETRIWVRSKDGALMQAVENIFRTGALLDE
ncbi:MAG TPA: hypothetical protein VFY29_20940, partial [Terriglobia bacterium]|nr:hypothetical protein [Terriglobia bacterium]